jgi:protein TonB
LPQFTDIDNPWRRLPWVLFTALLIWGALLWGFGVLLGQVAEEPQILNPIEAQLIELTPPAKHITVPEPPRLKPSQQVTPEVPRQVQQPVTQSPSQRQPVLESIEQTPAQSAPLLSLPETNLPVGNKATTDAMQPVFDTNARTSPNVPKGTASPPQFGASYLNNPKPGYPAAAKRMGMEGTVMLKVLVSRDGGALKTEIAQSSGYEILDKSAVEAVRKWRFIPARQGDSPLEEWVQVPVAFHLKK